MLRSMKKLWRGWKQLAHGIITLQNMILLSFAYFLGVGPTAVVSRIIRKKMIDRDPVGDDTPESFWIPLEPKKVELEDALRPF